MNVRSLPEHPSPTITFAPSVDRPARLDPRMTFDSFVPGSSNRLAFAAAQSVAETPGRRHATEGRTEGGCHQRQREHKRATPGNLRRTLFQIRLFQRRQPASSSKHHRCPSECGLRTDVNSSADGGADVFWRYSKNDAVYGVPGNIAIPALKHRFQLCRHRTGCEFDVADSTAR